MTNLQPAGGKLDEILRAGRPPGFNGRSPDPQSAAMAIPRALKELEQTVPAERIARDAGFSVRTLKRTWFK